MRKRIALFALIVLLICSTLLLTSCLKAVSFETNGGSAIGDIPVTGKFAMPANPTKAGFVFAGWYLDDALTNEFVYTSPSDITTSLILYARWATDTYTVTLDTQNGVLPSEEATTVQVKYGDDYNLPVPTKVQHTFLGWYDRISGGTQYADNEGHSIADWEEMENITLYARWQVNTLTVTYDYQGATGSNTELSEDINYGDAYTLAVPTRTGFTFGGWYANPNGGGTQYTDAEGASIANWAGESNLTVYAKWVLDEISALTYEGYTAPITYGTTVTLTASATHALSGEIVYKWYKDNVIVTTTNTVTASEVSDSGTYKVVATLTVGGQTVTKETTVNVVINKADLTGVNGTNFNGVYDAQPHSIAVTYPSGAVIEYKVGEGEWSETNPTFTNVGETVTVYYRVKKANYNDFSGSNTVTITARPLAIQIEDKGTNVGEELATLTWRFINGTALAGGQTNSVLNVVLTKEEGTNAGTYTITGAYNNSNYSVTWTSGTYTISAIAPVITNHQLSTSTIYVGQTLSFITISGDVSVAGTFAWKNPTLAPTAGTANYTVVFTPTDTNNYSTVEIQVPVNVVQLTVTYIDDSGRHTQNVNYGGSAIAPTVTPRDGFTAEWDDIDVTNVTENIEVIATYSAIASGISVTINGTSSVTYGTSVTLTAVEANSLDVTFTWYKHNGTTWEEVSTGAVLTLSNVADSGAYRVVAEIDNYGTIETSEATKTVTIAPATMEVTASAYNAQFDGLAHGISIIAPAGATVEYRVGEGAWSTVNPTYTDVCTVSVEYRVSKTNHETVIGSRVISIGQRNITVTINDKTSVYGVSLVSLDYDITVGSSVGDDLNIVLTKADGTAVGEYAITGTCGNTNYNVTWDQGVYTITQATPVYTAPTASGIYWGQALSSSTLSLGTGAGTFAWKNGASIPDATGDYTVVFTPSDTNYASAEMQVNVTVTKLAVTFTHDGDNIVAYVRYNGTVDKSAYVPTARTGYSANWATTSTSNITANITVEAVYTANTYKVVYDYNGATGNNGLAFAMVTYGQGATLAVPTRTGYTFVGWKHDTTTITSANGELLNNWNIVYAGNATEIEVVAEWTKLTVSVNYHYQGADGNCGEGSRTVTYGETFTLIVPTKTNFTFVGWFSDANGAGTRYTNNLGEGLFDWHDESNVTLYAYWMQGSSLASVDASSVHFGEGILYWDAVTGAAGYTVQYNGVEYTTTDTLLVIPMFEQNTSATVTIKALGEIGSWDSEVTTVNIFRPYDSTLTVNDIDIGGAFFGTVVTNTVTAPADAKAFDKIYTLVVGKQLNLTAFSTVEIIGMSGENIAEISGNNGLVTKQLGAVKLLCTKSDSTTEVRYFKITPNAAIFSSGEDIGLRANTIANLNIETKVTFLDKEVKAYTAGTANIFIPDMLVEHSSFAFSYSLRMKDGASWVDVNFCDYVKEVGNHIQFKPSAEGKIFELSVGSRYRRDKDDVTFIIEINDGVNVYTQLQLREYFADLTVSTINILRNIILETPYNADYYFYSWRHDFDGVYEYGTDDPSRADYNPELYYSQPGAVMGKVLTDIAMPGGAQVEWDAHGYAGLIAQTDFSSLYNTANYHIKEFLGQLTYYTIDRTVDGGGNYIGKTPIAYARYINDTAKTTVGIAELRTLFYNVTLGPDDGSTGDMANWRAGALLVDYTYHNGVAIKASGVLYDILGNDITDIVASVDGNHVLSVSDIATYENGYTESDLTAFNNGTVGTRAVIARTAESCYNELFVRTNFMVTTKNPLYNSQLTVLGNYYKIDGSNLAKFQIYTSFDEGGEAVEMYTSDSMAMVERLNVPMHLTFEGVFGIYGKLDNDINYADDYNSFTWNQEGMRVTMNDMTFIGNDARPDGYDKAGNPITPEYYYKHGFQTFRTDKSRLTLNNCLVKQALTNIHVQNAHVNVNKSLLYNTFDWSIYMTLRSVVRCEDSYIGYSGGASIGMQTYLGHKEENVMTASKYRSALVELHDTFVSNWVSGTETWFEVYGLSTAAAMVKTTLDDTVKSLTGNERKVTIEQQFESGTAEFFNFALLGFTTNGSVDNDVYNVIIETTDDEGNVHTYSALHPGHDNMLESGDPRISGMFMTPVGQYTQTEDFVRYIGTDIQSTVQPVAQSEATSAIMKYLGSAPTYPTGFTAEEQAIIGPFMTGLGDGTYTPDQAGATAYITAYVTKQVQLTAIDRHLNDPKGCVLGEVFLALGTPAGSRTARQQEIAGTYSALGADLAKTVTYFAMQNAFRDSANYYTLGDTDGTVLLEAKGSQTMVGVTFRFTLFVWHYGIDDNPAVELTPNAA